MQPLRRQIVGSTLCAHKSEFDATNSVKAVASQGRLSVAPSVLTSPNLMQQVWYRQPLRKQIVGSTLCAHKSKFDAANSV
jgi:hypothetical protein